METRNIKINILEKKNNFQNCRREHLMSVPGNILEMDYKMAVNKAAIPNFICISDSMATVMVQCVVYCFKMI